MSMEYVGEFQREHADKEEEEEEEDSDKEEEGEARVNSREASSFSGHHHRAAVPQQQNQWALIRRFEDEPATTAAEATNFSSKLQLMELSLKSSDEETSSELGGGGGEWSCTEREHMFDKVVTPSDVGKLNRLVIPKQHAEKYFPLDSSANEKGLLLNFEDRNGKPWRFRYSYWNSSQSYVMTKGWSRFVKEKKLDAGDVVSFQRGVGELGKNRLYIDWRRRPYAPPNPPATPLLTPLPLLPSDHHFNQSSRWYSMPPPTPVSMPLRVHHQHLQYHGAHPYYNRHQQYYSSYQHPHTASGTGSASHQNDQYFNSFLRGGGGGGASQYSHSHSNLHLHHQVFEEVQRIGGGGNIVPMVIESVPVGRHATNTSAAAPPSHESKRLRLFGVNMEYCPIREEEEEHDCDVILSSSTASIPADVTVASRSLHHLPSSSLRVRLPNNNANPLQPSTIPAEFLKKGKSTSLSFALDP